MSQSSQATGYDIARVFHGETMLQTKFAAITASASGATTIVAASAGQQIYVLRWNVTANGAVNVNLQSHTTTANATGLHYMTQFVSAGGGWCPGGIFATSVGEALDINLSGAQAVGGELTYVIF